MMILRTSAASPFGRKALLCAAIAGLSDKIEILATDTGDASNGLAEQNPLGKIPALLLPDGAIYFDSRVIVEYFDHLTGGALIPSEAGARFSCLTRAALADGVMEASVLQIYELRRRAPEKQDQAWLESQAEKVARGLAVFEKEPPAGKRRVDHAGLAAALGYLDLRFEGKWRATHPKLAAWLARFAADIPDFAATAA